MSRIRVEDIPTFYLDSSLRLRQRKTKAISLYLGLRKGFYLALTRKIRSILYLYYIAKSGCYAQFKVGVNLRTL